MYDSEETFSIGGRVRSMQHAFDGVFEMVRGQHNAWIHLLATVCTVTLAAFLGVSRVEWCILVLTIVSVWVAEALNTAFELLCDIASPDFHPLVKQCKDVAAGAVLLSAVGAVVIGMIIFLPYLLALSG
ncbi:MAG: diacylglycerol kinase family protein [Halioglobus sp.]|nr:diacylglycerol kinase family protein [Halioglobus sp.]